MAASILFKNRTSYVPVYFFKGVCLYERIDFRRRESRMNEERVRCGEREREWLTSFRCS